MSSQFQRDWLEMRARHDGAARSADLEGRLRAALPNDPLIVDLGCGTAANLLHLAPRLGGRQRWLLVDNDEALLADVPPVVAAWAKRDGARWEHDGSSGRLRGAGFDASVSLCCANLDRELSRCLENADVVVTSAFLDLAGAAWLDELSALLAARRCLLLATLTADGTIVFSPEDPEDPAIVSLFCEHQQRDKGLGIATGPNAVPHLVERLEALGLDVVQVRSDWVLGEEDDIQKHLIAGIGRAVDALSPGVATDWCARRLDLLRAGGAVMRVGHRDLYAAPRVATAPG